MDYRELIKHLSKAFNVRIEMRQIRMREEVSRVGGVGLCGSYSCCHTWSTNFKSDSPYVARYKNISKRQGHKFECDIKDERTNTDRFKLDEIKTKSQEHNKAIIANALSYENVVGQDSITRFDTKDNKRKKNNSKKKKRKS
jgi:predicted RNA-binding protein with PUA-like domain